MGPVDEQQLEFFNELDGQKLKSTTKEGPQHGPDSPAASVTSLKVKQLSGLMLADLMEYLANAGRDYDDVQGEDLLILFGENFEYSY